MGPLKPEPLCHNLGPTKVSQNCDEEYISSSFVSRGQKNHSKRLPTVSFHQIFEYLVDTSIDLITCQKSVANLPVISVKLRNSSFTKMSYL